VSKRERLSAGVNLVLRHSACASGTCHRLVRSSPSGRREADLGEELRFHIDRETERLVVAGVELQQARLQARRTFGSVEAVKEESRDARGTTFVDHLARDTRHAARRLRRDWRFTAAAVLILGLGIGVNAAMFSVINAVLFRPQAVVNPDTLVDIYQNAPGGVPTGNTYAAYLDMAAYTDVFAGSAVTFIPHPATYSDGGPPRQVIVENASASYLTVLGLRPARTLVHRGGRDESARSGRPRPPRLDGAVCVDPGCRRRIVRIDGMPVTVVGVGPRIRGVDEFRRSYRLLVAAQVAGGVQPLPNPFDRGVIEAAFMVKARLRPGVTVADAGGDVDARLRLAREFPRKTGAGIGVFAWRDVRIHPRWTSSWPGSPRRSADRRGSCAPSPAATWRPCCSRRRRVKDPVRLAVGHTRPALCGICSPSVLLALAEAPAAYWRGGRCDG
jgi:putative ABC transport system permease protein